MQPDSFIPFDVEVDAIPLVGRSIVPDDYSYIYHSWVEECACFREHPRAHTRAAIDLLLDDPSTVRLVLCDPSDRDFIVGFLVGSIDVLHMAFVKGSFRTHGIARWMLSQVGISQGRPFGHTFRTRDLDRAKRRGWDPVHIGTFSVGPTAGQRT